MSLPKRYNPKTAEPRLQALWQENGVYHYDPDSDAPRYTIDTPPPTVSGNLHLGHVYSYSHTDFFARYQRMNGRNVYYPMGFDDNGLPTGRLVEKRQGVTAADIGRGAFIERCLAISEEAEADYRALWQRLGLSVDWRYSYRSIDERSRRISQWSFLDLYKKGLAYRQKAPAIWCPECQTAIAQAEVNDLDRASIFYTLDFRLADGASLPIATTRPELLPACVAVFVHPEDGRFQHLIGQQVTIPLFGRRVPLLADPGADPEKGTGAVMCCTFGDTADVAWWRMHDLPLIEAIGRDGRLTEAAAPFAGLTISEGRRAIIQAMDDAGQLLDQEPIEQTIGAHERCDTPVEYIVTPQWFIRVLPYKDEFLAIGERIEWQPPHMKNRYLQWVENLGWDWCISRQRAFGVPFPLWTCADCGETILAGEADLPIDPTEERPSHPCPACNGQNFIPDPDVMDTWATSSMSPQIAGQWDPHQPQSVYDEVYPFSLRPQAHEIIRTWAFYTIVKSHFHFGKAPFKTVAISGWGLAPEGTAKLSKSRGGGVTPPLEMMAQYSADAVRYWAASTGLGKDAAINEEKIQAGDKLVTKLWNVARFSQRFLEDWRLENNQSLISLSLADRWILARTQQLIQRVTALMDQYEYATAKGEIEAFFWKALADNYLEMAKLRLYDEAHHDGPRLALYQTLLATLKLLAPFLPYVTEQIYLGLFAEADGAASIHRAAWPQPNPKWLDETAAAAGEQLVEIATAVRRYKSENNLSLGAGLAQLYLATDDANLAQTLQTGVADLQSITRAQKIEINGILPDSAEKLVGNGRLAIAIQP